LAVANGSPLSSTISHVGNRGHPLQSMARVTAHVLHGKSSSVHGHTAPTATAPVAEAPRASQRSQAGSQSAVAHRSTTSARRAAAAATADRAAASRAAGIARVAARRLGSRYVKVVSFVKAAFGAFASSDIVRSTGVVEPILATWAHGMLKRVAASQRGDHGDRQEVRT